MSTANFEIKCDENCNLIVEYVNGEITYGDQDNRIEWSLDNSTCQGIGSVTISVDDDPCNLIKVDPNHGYKQVAVVTPGAPDGVEVYPGKHLSSREFSKCSFEFLFHYKKSQGCGGGNFQHREKPTVPMEPVETMLTYSGAILNKSNAFENIDDSGVEEGGVVSVELYGVGFRMEVGVDGRGGLVSLGDDQIEWVVLEYIYGDWQENEALPVVGGTFVDGFESGLHKVVLRNRDAHDVLDEVMFQLPAARIEESEEQ